VNYFGLSIVTGTDSNGMVYNSSNSPGLTVQQAAAIDAKMDDGFLQSGNVKVEYEDSSLFGSNGQGSSGGLNGASWNNCSALQRRKSSVLPLLSWPSIQ
jgi:hypothetical protein